MRLYGKKMKKVILSIIILIATLLAHDFGDVPEIKLDSVPKGKPLMVMEYKILIK